MTNIRPVKKITLTEQVMNQIASLITNGDLKENEKLPNERDLANKLGVTRSRVREALRALSLIGLVTIKPGEGTFVNKDKEPIPADTITWMFHNEINNIAEIFDVRKLFETEIYLLASKNITKENKTTLKNMITNLEKTLINNPENHTDFQNILDDFDLKMAEWSGNKVYVKLMQQIIYLRRTHMVKILNVPGALQNSFDCRTSLVQAIDSDNLDVIKESIKRNFLITERFYKSPLK